MKKECGDRFFLEIGRSNSKIKNYFLNNFPELKEKRVRHLNFNSCEIPKEIWLQEPVLSEINSVFEIERAGLLSLEKDRVYDWHKDSDRGVAINMLLRNDHSHSLFKMRPSKFVVEKIKELKYEPDTFYLFNTQADHCVINFNKTRYVFSCEFKKKKDELNYMTVLDWIKNNEK